VHEWADKTLSLYVYTTISMTYTSSFPIAQLEVNIVHLKIVYNSGWQLCKNKQGIPRTFPCLWKYI